MSKNKVNILRFLTLTINCVFTFLLLTNQVNAATPGVRHIQDFRTESDGLVNSTNGDGSADPETWQQNSQYAPDYFAHGEVKNGYYALDGDKFSSRMYLNYTGPGRITWGYGSPVRGPGNGYEIIGQAANPFAQSMSVLENMDGTGYAAVVSEPSCTSEPQLSIGKLASQQVDTIAGPWSPGRRLTKNDRIGFAWDNDGNFTMYLNGDELGTVNDTTYDITQTIKEYAVLDTLSVWMPRMSWWSETDGADINLGAGLGSDLPPVNCDANNDGQDDFNQANVAGLTNSVDNGNYIGVEVPNDCTFVSKSINSESASAKADPLYDYPLGLMDFQITCSTPGQNVTISQYYYDTELTGLKLRKYNSASQVYSDVTGATVSNETINGRKAIKVTYTVTDNGAGDEDNTPGVIRDPVGLGQTLAATATTSNKLSSTGASASYLPVATLSISILGLATLTRRKLHYKLSK